MNYEYPDFTMSFNYQVAAQGDLNVSIVLCRLVEEGGGREGH